MRLWLSIARIAESNITEKNIILSKASPESANGYIFDRDDVPSIHWKPTNGKNCILHLKPTQPSRFNWFACYLMIRMLNREKYHGKPPYPREQEIHGNSINPCPGKKTQHLLLFAHRQVASCHSEPPLVAVHKGCYRKAADFLISHLYQTLVLRKHSLGNVVYVIM